MSTLANFKGQVDMMMTLLQDLMNQAQMANNTFSMVNEYFDLVSLVRRCFRTMTSQCLLKKVNLIGPVIANPVDKIYFQ